MKVSIIIPFYNDKQFIQECLESVLDQSYRDIEVICVDDGSSDGTYEVVKGLVKCDERVRIIRQENEGLSAARNFGLTVASGDYVLFVDCDDMLSCDAVEKLVYYAEKNDLDHIIFGVEVFKDAASLSVAESLLRAEKEYFRIKNDSICYSICSGAEQFVQLMENDSCYVSACSRIFRRSLLEKGGIRFVEGIIHEDNIFTTEVLLSSERTVLIPDKFYKRRLRDGSIMTSIDQNIRHATGLLVAAMKMTEKRPFEVKLQRALEKYKTYLYRKSYSYLNQCNDIVLAKKCTLNAISSILGEKQASFVRDIVYPLMDLCLEYDARAQKYRSKRLSSRLKRLFGRKARKDVRTKEESNKVIKVSVIVPVYNAERHLRQALDSLCAQTLKDVEFICVDDGSRDASGAILDEYAARDGRFRVFHTVNQGAANARNFGMAQACGEYLAFMDADDYVEPVWLKEVYGISCKNKLDMCIFDFQMFSADTGEKLELWWTLKNHARKIVFNKVVSPGSVKMWPLSGSVTQGFYKRSFVVRHVLFFQNIQVSEDALFVYEAMLRAKRVLFLADVYYWYRRGHSSSIVAKMAGDYSNQIEYISRIANSYWKTWSIFRWRTYRTCLRRILYDVMYYGEKDRVVSKWLNHEGWKRLKASKFSRRKLGKALWGRYKRLLSNKEI